MIHYREISLAIIVIIISGCSSFSQKSTPVEKDMHDTATATQSHQKTMSVPTTPLIPNGQRACLAAEETWSSESLLDGTLILGNTQDQKIYLLLNGNEKPQPLLGKDPTWDPNFHLSPNGEWLAYSILSDDGLSFTALKVRSLNGDQVWEIPYQPDWYSERYWINNEYIEIIKSEAGKNTLSPYTGMVILDPFNSKKVIDIDFDKMNLKFETPYYDPTVTRMIYLRDDFIPKTGDPLVESVVITDKNLTKELWVKNALGWDSLIAAWSSDGKEVVIQNSSELIIVNLDKGSDSVLQRDGLKFYPSVFPAWSPDGRYIAARTSDSLVLYDSINDIFTDFCLHDQILGFYWSPNSQQLAVDIFLTDGSKKVLVIDINNNKAVSFRNINFVLLGWTDIYNK